MEDHVTSLAEAPTCRTTVSEAGKGDGGRKARPSGGESFPGGTTSDTDTQTAPLFPSEAGKELFSADLGKALEVGR